jgi:hypothetical protein
MPPTPANRTFTLGREPTEWQSAAVHGIPEIHFLLSLSEALSDKSCMKPKTSKRA